MAEAHPPAGLLESAFTRIRDTRMRDIPILNAHLGIEVVGARRWTDHWLAALITPWFINLVLVPATAESRASLEAAGTGTRILHRFPAGRFDFLVSDEEDIGRFQMCSLFSPVLEFEDHEAARLCASAALEALFDATLDEGPAQVETSRERHEQGTSQPASSAHPEPSDVSRRELVRGRLFRGEGLS